MANYRARYLITKRRQLAFIAGFQTESFRETEIIPADDDEMAKALVRANAAASRTGSVIGCAIEKLERIDQEEITTEINF